MKRTVTSSSLGEYVGRRLLTDWTVALLVYGAESSPDFEFEQDYTGDFKDCLNKAYEYFDIIKQNDLDAYVTLSGNRTGDEYEFDDVYEIEDTFPDEFVDVESSTKAVKASEEETTEDEFNAVVDTLPKGVKDYLYFLTGDWDEGDAREASVCGYLAALVDAELITSSERRMIERYLTGGDLLHGTM